MPSIVDDVKAIADDILGVRDEIGAVKYSVYILTRIWDGTELGDGTAVDSIAQILPTPYIVDLSSKLRLMQAGQIKEGDIMLKSISKQSYPDKTVVSLDVPNNKTEKFYYIDSNLYEIVNISEKYIHWNIHIRLTSKQKTYIP